MASATDELQLAAKRLADENGTVLNQHHGYTEVDAANDDRIRGQHPLVHFREIGVLGENCTFAQYEDARSGEGRRRLSVCARDVYRLVDRFRGTAVAQMDETGCWSVCYPGRRGRSEHGDDKRREQCHVVRHRDGRPGADDDDAAEGKVPIALREPREVRSDSLQTPHDPRR